MIRGKYYEEDALYYSAVYGGGIYEETGEMIQNPLGGAPGENETSPLAVNLISGEIFFLKGASKRNRDRYRSQILKPPRTRRILWPSDMVHLNERQREECGLLVARAYKPAPALRDDSAKTDALLFPHSEYPAMVNGQEKLASIEAPSWKVQEVRDMAAAIAAALESLNRSGYFYTDIHLSRLYFTEQGDAYLDFSNLIFSLRDSAEEIGAVCAAESGEYPIEFADPAVVRGLIPHLDFHSQNYSLCALFFYLFLGRYPYDGRLMAGYADSTPQEHYSKFRDYHKMPVFIFDPQNTQNSLGVFWQEQQVVALWAELPASLRELFIRTLRQENAERTVPVNNPTPSAWLRAFQELGWYQKEETRTGV